ncbi:mycothiol transferase [Luteococcus peritonei]|uniref:DUF664 domain-containing protein n=1 Tax=Luteococcus peritonei TaxID=88874 RepID=A0ABW4RSG5_9ACTN
MNGTKILGDGFARIAESLPGLLDGLDRDQLAWRADAQANPVGWLVWHLARVEDDHTSGVAAALGLDGAQQVWDQGWRERFALPYPDEAIGYGQESADVAAFQADAQLLADYYAEVHRATAALLEQLDDQALDAVVDDQWDPPVTAGVRLVSVVNDITQHLGQAAYLKGLLERRA